jgi:pimeloyl-ACP methyl ester carboxylesterase
LRVNQIVREFGNVKLSRVFGDITRTDKEVRVMVNVHAVQLPLHSLADDVAATKRAIDHIGGPIVLVGHSYGGFVITNTAYNNSKVLGLVYVAAFAPAQGQSLLNFVNPGKLPKDI